MPRITPADELQLIESIVAAHPGGIGIAEIELAMAQRQGGALNRRTLQRRLLKLIDAQRIGRIGPLIAGHAMAEQDPGRQRQHLLQLLGHTPLENGMTALLQPPNPSKLPCKTVQLCTQFCRISQIYFMMKAI